MEVRTLDSTIDSMPGDRGIGRCQSIILEMQMDGSADAQSPSNSIDKSF